MRKASIYRNIVKSILTMSIILASSSIFAADPVRIYYKTIDNATERLLTGTYISVIYCSKSFSATVVEFTNFSGGSYGQWDYEVRVASAGITPSLPVGSYIETGSGINFRTAQVPNGVYIVPLEIVDPIGGIVRTITCEITKSESPTAVIEHVEPAAVVCEGTEVTLSAKEEAEYKYSWSKGGVKIKEGRNLTVRHDDAATGPGTYRLLVSRYGCEHHADQIISFNPNPSVTVTPPMEVCPNGTILLKSSPTGGTTPYVYNWTTSALNSIDPSVAGNQNITIAPAEEDHEGQYTVTVTDANGCKAVGVSDVTVHPIINPGSISGTQRICEDSAPKELKSTAPASGGDGTIAYLWVQSTDGGSTWIDADGTNDELTYTPPSNLSTTTMYKRTVSNSCGSAETLPVTVTVDKKVVLSLGGPYSTCPEVGVLLNGSISGGVSTGTWSVVEGSGMFDDPTKMDATFTPAAGMVNTDIKLKLVSDKPAAPSVCQAVSEVVVVKVHDKGKATYSFPTTVCNSAPEFPLDITPAGGTYTPNAYNDVTPFKPSDFNNGDTYTFKYNGVGDANGCAIDEDITISITSPQVFAITNTSPATYCASGDGVTINLDGSESGLTYTVYKDGNPTTHEVTGNGSTISIPGVKNGGGIYTIRATDANGCWIDMAGSVTLTQVSDVSSNTITPDKTTICEGSEVEFNGSEPNGGAGPGSYTYQWQKSEDGGGSWQDIGTGRDLGKIAVNVDKTIFRRFVTSGACDNKSTEVTISVFSPIQNNKLAATNTEICNGAAPGMIQGEVATSSGGPVSYIWQVSTDGTSYTTIAGATEKDYNALTSLTADTWYRRVATDGGTCPDDESAVVMIDVLDPLGVSATVAQEPTCGNSADGQLIATATGGKGSYTIFWKNDDDGTTYSGATINTATKGDYTVRVHEDGCATDATYNFTLTAPADVNGTATPTDVTGCFGNNNGEISVTAHGGTDPYTFTLGAEVQNGTSANFTGLTAGDYTINIEDSKGCPGSATATINQPYQLLMGTHDLVKPSCVGQADGQITVNATGGTGALTYTLNGGAPTPVGTPTTGLAAGIYDIVVTDAKGCSITGPETLADPVPVNFTSSVTPVTGCAGSTTGAITITAKGGTAPYEYSKDAGASWQSAATFDNLGEGDYKIKVRDANLCESAEQTVTVTEPNALNFTATPNSVLCHNSTDGKIEVSGIAGGTGSGYTLYIKDHTLGNHDGTEPYTPDNSDSHTFKNLEPDTYTITLTDGVCDVPKDVTIDAPPAITLTLDEVGKIICPTPPASFIKFTATGGTGTLRYDITGAMSKSDEVDAVPMVVQDLFQGSYSLTVTDEKGCWQGPIGFDIEAATNTLSWNNIYHSNVTCHGADDGEVEINIEGGIGPFTYMLLPQSVGAIKYEHLSEPSRKYTFTGVKPGVYSLTVVDEGNLQKCFINRGERVVVEEPKPITIDPIGSGSSWTNISCHDTNDGEITIAAKGGTGELIVTLYKNGSVHNTLTGSPVTFSGLDEGDYYVEITDPNGCTPAVSSTYTMVNPTEVVATPAGSTNIDCAGKANGTITITGVAGGSGAGYEYSIDGGITYVPIADPTSVFIDGLNAGDYTVQVRDGNGCKAAPIDVTITQPDPLVLTVNFTDPGCSSTFILEASAVGGTSPYEFSFDGGANWGTNDKSNPVGTGKYTIAVRDAKGCDDWIKDTLLTTPTEVVIVSDLTVLNQPSCEELGRMHIEAEGGTQPLNYQLYLNGSPVPVPRDENGNFTVKVDGDYHVVVTDANGCFPKTSTTVSINPFPSVKFDPVLLSITDVLCGGKATGAVTGVAVATGGMIGEIFYTLKNDTIGFSETNVTGVFVDLHASNYYYMVASDGASCADTLAFAITAPDTLKIEVKRMRQESTLGMMDGELDVVAHGGVAPYTYTLRSGSTVVGTNTDGKFKSLLSATYWAIVEDVNGCKDSVRVVLQSVNAYTIDHAVSCYGGSDGWFDLIIHGTPPYTIYGYRLGLSPLAWHFTETDMIQIDDTTYRLTNLVADKYFFMIGDQFSGINFQATIYEPDPLVVSMGTVVQPICATGGYGSVEFDVSGSVTYDELSVVLFTPTYVIVWERADGLKDTVKTSTPGTITVGGLDPGEYKFTVTTEHGCQPQEFDIIFPEISPIVVTTNVLQESSYGAGNGLIEANATGDNPIVTYHLLDKDGNLVETSAIGLFSNVSEGKYVVKAEDDLTCPGYSDTIYIRGTDVVVDDITPVTCFGENQGAFKFHIEHGFPRFKSVSVADASGNTVAIAPEMALYSCNEPITAENLLAGDYTITIVDSLDNPITHTVTIGEPDKLIIDATLTAPDCASNGSIALTVVGGVAPYTMEWAIDEGALEPLSSSTIDIVQGGTYRVVVTDANNCSTEWSQFVAPAESITLALEEVSNPTCFGGDNGRIAVEAANDGSSMYQYLLEKDGTLINITDNGVFENLSKGDYKVVVQNINTGCSQSFSYTLVDGAEAINIAFDGFIGKLNCPSDADGYATAVVTGGSGSYTYVWPQLGESTSSVSGLTPGTYEVIVADDLGCTATASYTIDGPKPFVFDKATRTEAKCRNSAIPANLGGKLSVGLVEGGTAPYSFYLVDETNHSIREGQPNFTGLGAGIYEVWVEDANGCRDMYYDTVLISPINDFEIGAMDTTVCFTNEVELKANVILGDVYSGQPLKYSWWSEANAANVSPDATGETYPLEGLDVNVYRYKLRVSQEGGDRCYVEKWFDVGVYPKIDIHVPLYVSSVQNDTILSILFNQEYNVDVSTSTFDYNTSFEWKPSGVFTRGNSWNSSIFMTPEKYEELKQTYPHRFKTLRDPQTKRDGDFFLVDVVATTDVGCQDSLTLYTKIVNKLYLANVFSPNGDGRNDIWKLPKEYLFPDLEIEIFNRWGALVWSAAGDKAARGWDGRTNNGKVLPIGTYWYVIKFNINSSEWKPLTGSVTIVK